MPRGDFLNEVGEARRYALALVEHRDCGREAALAAAARSVGISKWSLWSLYHGRRKSVGHGTLSALRREYLRLCEKQIALLEAEVRDLKRRCGEDHDAVTSLGAAVARVAEKVRKARSIHG